MERPADRPARRAARARHDLRGRRRATACRTRRRWSRPRSRRSSIRRLLAAGLPVVEATSFVHPRWVPQLADAAELMTMLGEARAATCPVLVPNERGLDRALELGCRHIAIFGSATETFAQKNLNRSLDEQFAMFEPTVRRARDAGLDVRAYVSMCFGDPWEGAVPVEQVVAVGKRLFDLGASQLSLGDTIGVGTAGHVTALVAAFGAAGMGTDQLAMHFHDTYGQALANTYAGAAGRHHDVRRQRRRPRRLPLRQERHRQPRHRGPGLDAAPASASSTASTSTRSSRPAPGWPATSAGPSPSAWSVPSPAARGAAQSGA